MANYYHSVVLDEKACKGCTNCIKKCPTEAIRVRKSKARIINERCIDCGECIKICPYKAKIAQTDSWDMLANFKYNIALPAPTLYMQFKNAPSRAHILSAIKLLGFDYVYEVARGAEIVTQATKLAIEKGNLTLPIISSACPAVVKLIQIKFPNLIPNILQIKSPMEVSAANARREFCALYNVEPEDVGVFFISPCAAKMTSVRAPIEMDKSNVSGVLSIKMVYFKLLNQLSKLKDKPPEDIVRAGYSGVRWSSTGGEALSLNTDKFLAVDGIHNVIKIFEELEDDRLEDVDFIEASACIGGCLGGPLTIENVYVAKTRSRKFNDEPDFSCPGDNEITEEEMTNMNWECDFTHKDIMTLDPNIEVAIQKLDYMEQIIKDLPGLDCGACGAPSCKALAEDIVRGNASDTDCIFKLREKVRELARQMIDLEEKMPPVLDKETDNTDFI